MENFNSDAVAKVYTACEGMIKWELAMEVYETNDFKRYGEKIHFFDNIKKPELLERINAMNYEGGIYSPYNALFYAAVTALRSGETFHQNAGAREHTGVSHKSSLS